MKRILCLLLVMLVLAGCGNAVADPTEGTTGVTAGDSEIIVESGEIAFESRFGDETVITLSDEGVKAEGVNALGVYSDSDIVYYEDRDSYDSGNPYGEGELHERHSADEAADHTVVHITKPGAYRVSGRLSAGQIAVDLGEDAYEDPNAVVELILDGADITCTVAPAIVFYNVYECDGAWSTDTAKAEVDTSKAGANLILAGGSENFANGSHVARIYKDKEGEKKLWKIDGAVYSFMSMNVYGPGGLEITADNEGLNSELHLTINGGDIAIRSGNDGINTNEDGVSVTTINGGSLHIIAGLGEEGDGIDSNGYLVINGGSVVSSANPAADAGLDSDLGSFINGGTVVALGSSMDWAESDSGQVTMNLQFAQYCDSGSAIVVTREDGTVLFAYDPGADEVLGENVRRYQGAIVSCGSFAVGENYQVWLDGSISGTETGGVYSEVTAYEGGTRMMYTGTDVVMRGPGGMGGFGGGERPEMPEGEMPTRPEGMEPPEGFGGKEQHGERPEGQQPPELPEGETMPEGFDPGPGWEQGGRMPGGEPGEGNSIFHMQDKVNFFSGLTALT